ncbi:MAG: hypothetical protein GX616_18780 [Planctomycetes bacterium]|nr:hypothetical protein [Planctomycetota bacterium]
MTEVVSDQSSVVSGGTADPLAEACCPHCGYSLRGLPENRCPECGNAFDPAEVAGTFQAKWPALLKWVLLGYVISGVFASPFLISSLLSLRSTPASRPFAMLTTLPYLVRALVFAVLGAIAALGLHRRRDWGRKLGVAVFASVCLTFILPVPLSVAFGNPIGGFRRLDLLLYWLSQSVDALPPFLLLIFLTTGLRRRSLARRPEEAPILLSRSRFNPRKDWLLLLVVIFINMGVLEAWLAASCGGILHYLSVQGYSSGRVVCLSSIFITSGFAVWLWLSAILQWRRPRLVRTLVILNLATFAAGLAIQQTVNHVVWPSPSPLAVFSMYAARALLAVLLPWLPLLIFVFRDLTDADLQLVSRPRQR